MRLHHMPSGRLRYRRRPLPQRCGLWVLLAGLGCLATGQWVVGRQLPRPPVPLPPTPAADYHAFDALRTLATARTLAQTIGPRPGGSAAERRAAAYLARRLRALGYATRVQTVALAPGMTTCNVIGVAPRAGLPASAPRVLIGAHLDAVPRPGCAGANDNASGVAVALELARLLAREELPFRLEVVCFGAEECQRGGSLIGSGAYVAQLGAARPAAMLCLDMVGRGGRLRLVHGGSRGARLAAVLGRSARRLGLPCTLVPGATGSDYIRFAAAGVPAVWVERGPDPDNHSPRDTVQRLELETLESTGRLVAHALLHLTPADLGRPARPVTIAQKETQVAAAATDKRARRLAPRGDGRPREALSTGQGVGGFYGRVVRAFGRVRASAANRFAPGRPAKHHP